MFFSKNVDSTSTVTDDEVQQPVDIPGHEDILLSLTMENEGRTKLSVF